MKSLIVFLICLTLLGTSQAKPKPKPKPQPFVINKSQVCKSADNWFCGLLRSRGHQNTKFYKNICCSTNVPTRPPKCKTTKGRKPVFMAVTACDWFCALLKSMGYENTTFYKNNCYS